MTSGDQQRPSGTSSAIGRPSEDLADQPAQQAQPGDAQADGQKPDADGAGDPPAHAFGEDEKARFDVHENEF